MVNRIRTSDLCGLNKGCGLKFCVGSRVQQNPEESWRRYWPKCCEYNHKDEDNSPKTLNDKNQQASSQKFIVAITQYFKGIIFFVSIYIYILLFIKVDCKTDWWIKYRYTTYKTIKFKNSFSCLVYKENLCIFLYLYIIEIHINIWNSVVPNCQFADPIACSNMLHDLSFL